MRLFKLYLFIFACIAANIIFAQSSPINQFDSLGFKIGTWVNYDDNGRIESKGDFVILNVLMSAEDLFANNLSADTTRMTRKSVENGIWEFFDQAGRLEMLATFENGIIQNKKVFYYDSRDKVYRTVINGIATYFGTNQELKIDTLFYSITGKAGSKTQTKLKVTSNSEFDIGILVTSDSNKIEPIQQKVNVKSDSSCVISLTTKFQLGQYSDKVHLNFGTQDSNAIEIIIQNFGFHFSSSAFSPELANLKMNYLVEDTLIIFREDESCELKVYQIDKFVSSTNLSLEDLSIFLTFPLSRAKNTLDFSAVRDGYYILRLVDYQNKKSSYLILEKR